MRFIITLSIFFLAQFCIRAQLSEGIIIKKIETFRYIPNTRIIDQNTPSRIDTVSIYVKGNKYKKVIKGMSERLLYGIYILQLGNKIYYVNENSKSIVCDLGSDSLINSFNNKPLKQLKSKETILGVKCAQYILSDNKDKRAMVYCINDKWQFKQSFFEDCFMHIGLVVKSTKKNKFTIRYENVIKLIPIELNDTIFELPDYPIKEMDLAKEAKAFIN